MAKKIYNVTFVDGTTQQFTAKKAIKALEGIVSVEVNGENITSEFIKEEEVMGTQVIEEVVVEELEAVEEVVEEVVEVEEVQEVEEGPTTTILFTGSRGTAKSFSWYAIDVNPDDDMVKAKGCAAQLPVQVAEALGADKFVAWVPKQMLEACVAEHKQVRGMASTFSDVFARYCKVNELKYVDKATVVLEVFIEILDSIKLGNTEGCWVRQEEAPEEVVDVEAVEEV